jgi:hypothetical protein
MASLRFFRSSDIVSAVEKDLNCLKMTGEVDDGVFYQDHG